MSAITIGNTEITTFQEESTTRRRISFRAFEDVLEIRHRHPAYIFQITQEGNCKKRRTI